MSTALLFDRDQAVEIDSWKQGLPKIGRSAVLWIDVVRADAEELESLGELLDLDEDTVAALRRRDDGPTLVDRRDYLELTVCAPTDETEREISTLTCLVAERWIVTVRDESLAMVDTFRERATASGEVGRLDGPEFLANLLEWLIESYFGVFEDMEQRLDEIDAAAMAGDVEEREAVVGRLVEVRREIGRLRRALTSHRELILALARPELEAITSSSACARFAALRDRLEDAIRAARDSRDSVVGSFDIVLATTGQRTNEIMKVLTLASVLILPGTFIAGVMGMNFKLGIFTNTVYFWATVAAMLVIAVVTLGAARMRHWI